MFFIFIRFHDATIESQYTTFIVFLHVVTWRVLGCAKGPSFGADHLPGAVSL